MLDTAGGFFELAPLGYDGSIWGVRPISTHLRMIPDMAPFRGWLVLGSNQVSSIFDNNLVTGQSQSGLAFIKEDDLWGMGPVQGWGGVWRGTHAAAGVPSDPFLMTGYDKKVVHVNVHSYPGKGHEAEFQRQREDFARRCERRGVSTAQSLPPAPQGGTVKVEIQVDVLGCAGHTTCPMGWVTHTTLELDPTGEGAPAYLAYTFPTGFSAHWVRAVANADVNATAFFHYT